MKSVKPEIDEASVRSLVEKRLGWHIEELTAIEAGQIARTYSFAFNSQKFVIQFYKENMSHGPRIEQFLSRRLLNNHVPVRQFVSQGKHESLHFSISKNVNGQGLDTVSPEEFNSTLPSVMDILVNISSADISDTEGYGWLDEKGNGIFASWQEHLEQIKEEEPGQFYGKWHDLFNTTFLEKDLFYRYYEKMQALMDKIPDTRALIHGGFGYGNVLVENNEVTLVLDWTDARYGDSLLDVAYLDFWRTDNDVLDQFQQFCEQKRVIHENYKFRILCYKYYLGLDTMRFFSKIENQPAYNSTCEILRGLDTE